MSLKTSRPAPASTAEPSFPPTRAAALARLAAFVPHAARDYAAGRNDVPLPDQPGAVSALSPYLRVRLITEAEVVGAVLAAHALEHAAKFVQEVFWRSYWKGWLELRPAVWTAYEQARDAAFAACAADPSLNQRYQAAISGRTGIACFDCWSQELCERNWLHNHVRMWFASIWCFTLRLPWALGADFFLQHLLDGDAASNTLSWRWVIGSQTRGKHYVATAHNIARHTAGRFDPAGSLDEHPTPILLPEPPGAGLLPRAAVIQAAPAGLLLHDDDLGAADLPCQDAQIRAIAGFVVPADRSPRGCAEPVAAFAAQALEDALQHAAARHGTPAEALAPEAVAAWAAGHGLAHVVTPWAPIGWTRRRLDAIEASLAANGIALHRVRRSWDSACWPLATKGFFPFREHIPELVTELLP